MPKTVLLAELKPHPLNEEIYGAHDKMNSDEKAEFEKLKESIANVGVLERIVIDEDMTIISGHRRYYALLDLGHEETVVDQFEFKTEGKRLTFLLTKNQYRSKTNSQRIREGMYMEANIKLLAKQNMAHKSPEEYQKIVTRDAVGEAVGMSGSSYDRGKKVVEKIDELRDEGREEEADALEEKVNVSVSGAHKEVKPPAKKNPEKKPVDPLFWYEEELKSLIEIMTKKAEKMAKKRKSTTANSLSWFFNTIQEDAKRYRSWLQGEMHDCPVCKGMMTLASGVACGNCINGKVGFYEIPGEDDFEESTVIIEEEPVEV